MLSDEAGDEVPGSRVRYYPYGQERTDNHLASLPTDFGFTGQRWEQGFGLYYYKARYYDPMLGRFVQADTIVPEPGNPQALNRYAYVYNNPLRYTDPSGHWLETLLDIAFLAYDIHQIATEGWTTENTIALVADLACIALPGATGGGPGTRLALAGGGELATRAAVHIPAGARAAQVGLKVLQFARGGPSEESSSVSGESPWERGTSTEAKDSLQDLPEQIHHLLTNKHSKWSTRFEQIVQKYGLDLDDAWNTVRVPQRGRHPEEYHEWVWEQLRQIDEIAKGNREQFLQLLDLLPNKRMLSTIVSLHYSQQRRATCLEI